MFDPDDFAGNPYGHITNQAGHAAMVGIPAGAALVAMGWPLVQAPIVVAAVYLVLWEWMLQRNPGKWDWRDSLMDTACVMAGASMVSGFMTNLATGAVCWAVWAAVVLWGGLRRYTP